MTDRAYQSIGDISKLIGVKPHTLRFWEEKFPYLKPKKINGVRYYNDVDIACLKQIQNHLKQKGYTIKGVNGIIKDIGIEAFRNMEKTAENQTPPNKLLEEQVKFDNIKVKENMELPMFGTPDDADEPPLPMFADTVGETPQNIDELKDILQKLKSLRQKL